MGLSFTIAAGPRQRNHSQVRVPWGLMTIFYCLKFQPPPTYRARSVYLYPQTLGSLFVASYDSQGYGRGIRSRLHKEFHWQCLFGFSRYSLCTGPTENTSFCSCDIAHHTAAGPDNIESTTSDIPSIVARLTWNFMFHFCAILYCALT
jgi:hypothetical protein